MRGHQAESLFKLLPPEVFSNSVAPRLLGALRTEVKTVVSPRSVEEVARLLKWASEKGVGVVPIGTGEHTYPRYLRGPCIVLTTSRLSDIQDYEPADLTITAGAGALIRDLSTEIAAHGQWLPFDPPDVLNRTLGGLVSSGLSGPLRTGYGPLRNHVLGATIVCGDGRVLRLGGKVVKNVAGFDILKPMVGSRGELAVIASVTVRLFPLPVEDRILVLEANDIAELVATSRAVATAPIMPASIVLDSTVNRARLLVRLHGAATSVDADQVSLEKHTGVSFEAKNIAESEHSFPQEGGRDVSEEFSLRVWVLPSRMEGLLDVLKQAPGVTLNADVYGGSVRVYLSGSVSDAESVLTGLRKDVEELGGTIRMLRMPAEVGGSAYRTNPSADERELAMGLKGVFDPHTVLWGME